MFLILKIAEIFFVLIKLLRLIVLLKRRSRSVKDSIVNRPFGDDQIELRYLLKIKIMPVFFLTDIEGSTEKWEKYRTAMGDALMRHDAILEESIKRYGGKIIKHTGDGFFAVFEGGDPLKCALEIQKRLSEETWGPIGELRIRIAINAGTADKRGDDYFGPAVNRTARILAAAWGGQILLTPEVVKLTSLPVGASIKDLGMHRLKDLGEPQIIFGLIHPDLKIIDFPPPRSLSARPNNLPVQTTPFIGRETEIREIKDLLSNSECRLLTITGAGGVGKTRLAIHCAAEMIEEFPQGVYHIALAPLSSINFLVLTIADSIKFSFYSQQDPKIQLLNYLREKKMLLLMDNFDNFIEGADFLVEILINAPDVKILVTSRERLNLRGEWIFQITGLKFPEQPDIENLEEFSALRLFLHNARRIQPGFSVSREDLPDLVRICQLVQGMPLAIELASSWVRALSIREICREIEKSLDFLTTTIKDIPERHRSLRAVFESSWQLLSEKEKGAFRKLSIFRGGFNREAAEKVAGVSIAQLSLLTDKSILQRSSEGRYSFLELIRQYAIEKLEEKSDEREEIERLHSGYYGSFLEQKKNDLISKRQKEGMNEIGIEIENIRAGYSWAVENQNKELVEKYLETLSYYYELMGWFKEADKLFSQTVKHWQTIASQPGRDKLFASETLGKVLIHQGRHLFRLGQHREAEDIIQQGLRLLQDRAEPDILAFAYNNLGSITYAQGDYDRAEKYNRMSLELYQKTGNARGIASAINNLGGLAYARGDYEAALKLYQECVDLIAESGDPYAKSIILSNISNIYYDKKNLEVAQKLDEESLKLSREINNLMGIERALINLGMVASDRGDYNQAKALYEEGLKVAREIGHTEDVIVARLNLADTCRAIKEFKDARQHYLEALNIAKNNHQIPLMLSVLLGLAKIEISQNKERDALKLLEVVLNHPAVSNDVRVQTRQVYETIKSKLPSSTIDEITAQTRGVELTEIVNEILQGRHKKSE